MANRWLYCNIPNMLPPCRRALDHVLESIPCDI
jgi:hypothetical protein